MQQSHVKMYLERNSQDYYGDLMRLMGTLHKDRGFFLQLTLRLEKATKAFNDRKADPALVTLIPEKETSLNQCILNGT